MEAWYFHLRQRKFRSGCFQLQVFNTYPKTDRYQTKSNKKITLLLLILRFSESDTLI